MQETFVRAFPEIAGYSTLISRFRPSRLGSRRTGSRTACGLRRRRPGLTENRPRIRLPTSLPGFADPDDLAGGFGSGVLSDYSVLNTDWSLLCFTSRISRMRKSHKPVREANGRREDLAPSGLEPS